MESKKTRNKVMVKMNTKEKKITNKKINQWETRFSIGLLRKVLIAIKNKLNNKVNRQNKKV